VARIRAAEGRPECLATAPRTTCALADGATSAGAIYILRASALRPQADGVTGAGFALTVEVLPDPPTGRTTENVNLRGLTPRQNVNLRGLTPRHDPYGKLMGIAGIDEWGKSEECCNATPDPYDFSSINPFIHMEGSLFVWEHIIIFLLSSGFCFIFPGTCDDN